MSRQGISHGAQSKKLNPLQPQDQRRRHSRLTGDELQPAKQKAHSPPWDLHDDRMLGSSPSPDFTTALLGKVSGLPDWNFGMFATRSLGRQVFGALRWAHIRSVSTLEGNPHIVCDSRLTATCDCGANSVLLQYIFPSESPSSHILSLLPSEPVNPKLAIGVTTKLPPTADSLRENSKFLDVLQEVFTKHAHEDPDAQSQAQVMVSTSGANLMSGGVLLAGKRGGRRRKEMGDSSGGASGQGGAGSAGRGGWIHISDSRRPPEYGRIAWYAIANERGC